MSWYIDIKCHKEIKFTDIQEIVETLPKSLKDLAFFNEGRGWNCQTDIHIPQGNVLTLHGAYGIPYGEMFEWMIKKLTDKGYHVVKIDESF